jgi:2,4-dienoyl-CoA reductase-like NADH-dependent reductase (Old Yellow Enzyme family)
MPVSHCYRDIDGRTWLRPTRKELMPNLFTPFSLKGVTLRNRIAMSPMTMHRSVDGKMNDFHVMYLGARAAGGFGLVFPEQIAIAPDGRTSVKCAGIYNDDQIDGLQRVTAMIKDMGAVPAIQLGHTGRKGSTEAEWSGAAMLPPGHPDGWQTVGPSAIAYGGRMPYAPRELSRAEIAEIHTQYAAAAQRAVDAGFEWLELHFAHGYLGASFLSPLANQRSDDYGGSPENRARFHLEAIDAVRDVWPDRFPLTARVGCDDLHAGGLQLEESIAAIGWMKDHGLDLVDLSLGLNTPEINQVPFPDMGFMVDRAARVRAEVGIPVATSWNLGKPSVADEMIRQERIDLVYLGRPALSNPHWPVWAAIELRQPDPIELLPPDWQGWLRPYRGHQGAAGWPLPGSAGDDTVGSSAT